MGRERDGRKSLFGFAGAVQTPARPIFGSDVASSRKGRVGEVTGQRTYHVLLKVYLVPSFPSLLPTQQVPSIPTQHLVRLELEFKHLFRRQGRRGKVGRGEGLGGWEERAGEEVVDSLDSMRLRCPRRGPGFKRVKEVKGSMEFILVWKEEGDGPCRYLSDRRPKSTQHPHPGPSPAPKAHSKQKTISECVSLECSTY